MLNLGFRLVVLFIALFCLIRCEEYKRYEIRHQQMGTDFRLVYYDTSGVNGRQLQEKVSATLDRINKIFSDYDPDSEINTLCRTMSPQQAVQVSKELWDVLRIAEKISQQSQGAFDVTIAPLSKIWRRAIRRQELPEPMDLESAKLKVDYRNINIDENEPMITFLLPDISLDFGGIAKGYALDQLADLLETAEISRYMIDGGGDLRIGNAPPGERGWKIRLMNGEIRLLSNTAVATSGDHFKYIEVDGTRYSHLVDPRTGLGVRNERTITVLGERAATTDAWASAWSVMSPQERSDLKQSGALEFLEIMEIEN